MKNEDSLKSKSVLSGKGFYIALVLSLVAIGGAAWLGISSAVKGLENNAEDDILPPKVITGDEWEEKPAETKKDDIPKETDTKPDPTEEANEPVSPEPQGFIMPIQGDVLNPYSGDKVVKSKTLNEWVMHTGIDIKSEVGAPVKTISGGKVIEVKNDDRWGTLIVIEHPNGITSHYMNLKSATNVKQNQNVKLGDVIGSVGETCAIEKAEEPHLHFGVKQNGEWIDPMSICK